MIDEERRLERELRARAAGIVVPWVPLRRPRRAASRLLLFASVTAVLVAAVLAGRTLDDRRLNAVASPAPTPAAPGNGTILTRPDIGRQARSTTPVVIGGAPRAGTFVLPYGGTWRYDGASGTLASATMPPYATEHPAPQGRLVAVERLVTTPGGYRIAKGLAIRDPQGAERVVYQASGDGFYWSGWSPDGRYVALWEIGQYSGSIDQDGRPLVVVDVLNGARVDLGPVLLNGTTAWAEPHTLAFIAGVSRMVWQTKVLRLWSPESGIRDLTGADVAALAPAWSAGGRRVYFVSGPSGELEPLAYAAGRGVGDRRIGIYDVASGLTRTLEHEPGYVEEGVRPSRDGTRLLVLRRRTVVATDINAIPPLDLEVWLTDPEGGHGTPLVRVASSGFGYYGAYPGPADWDWSE